MKKSILTIGALCALALSACGSGTANQAACEAYVDELNALPCYETAGVDAAAQCPATLDNSGCDISAYYDCLRENTACMDVGGMSVPDSSGISACVGMNTCG